MAGGVSIGMIGGSPLMKVLGAGGKVTGNGLPLTKALDGGGGLGGLMSQVMSGGGLQSIGQINPMQAITGQLQGAISGAVGGLGGMGGATGLISALIGSGGLSGAASGLLSAAGGLLSSSGQLGIAAHTNTTDMIGDGLDPQYGIDAVLGPVNAEDLAAETAEWVSAMTIAVLAGELPIPTATAQVQARAAALQSITDASAFALTTVADRAEDVAAVSTMAASFLAAPPQVQAVLAKSLPPEVVATMRASVASHMD